MHRALYIQELIVIIFKIIRADIYNSKATLASLARTCHSFHDPAIGLLWRSQYGLAPLLLCLGDSVKEIDVPPDARGASPLKRLVYQWTPSATQFSRFFKYAQLIEKISLFEVFVDIPSVDTRILDEVLSLSWQPSICASHRLTLFPKLRALTWLSPLIPSDYLCLFLGSGVPNIHRYSLPATECELPAFVLGQYSSPLTKFFLDNIDSDCPTHDHSLFITHFLSLSPKLTHVNLYRYHPVTPAMWIILSQLENLVRLVSEIPTDHQGPQDTISSVPSKPFPQLASLELVGDIEEGSFERFITNLMPVDRRLNKLHTLILSCCYQGTGVSAARIIQHLATLCDPSCLTEFQLSNEHQDDPSITPDIVPTSLIPLYAFHNLRFVLIHPATTIDLDNSALEQMAHAWPNLESLYLGSKDLWVENSRITLEGLIPLASLCPHLYYLNVVLDPFPSIPFKVRRMVRTTVFPNVLKVICVSREIILNRNAAKEIAGFLMALFPKLTDVDWNGGYLEDDYQGIPYDGEEATWDDVADMIRLRASRIKMESTGQAEEDYYADDEKDDDGI